MAVTLAGNQRSPVRSGWLSLAGSGSTEPKLDLKESQWLMTSIARAVELAFEPEPTFVGRVEPATIRAGTTVQKRDSVTRRNSTTTTISNANSPSRSRGRKVSNCVAWSRQRSSCSSASRSRC